MKLDQKLAVAALSCAALTVTALPAGAQVPRVELPSNSGVVVLEYTVIHQMLAEVDPEPLMRIHADGRVRVHFPVYMAKAGDYELRLSPSELRGLFLELSADGILDFDEAGTTAERNSAEAAERAAGRLHHVSDVTETLIDMRLASYRPAGAAAAIPGFEKSVRWPNVHTDAQRFRGVAGVQSLARAEERLRSILDRSDLIRVR